MKTSKTLKSIRNEGRRLLAIAVLPLVIGCAGPAQYAKTQTTPIPAQTSAVGTVQGSPLSSNTVSPTHNDGMSPAQWLIAAPVLVALSPFAAVWILECLPAAAIGDGGWC